MAAVATYDEKSATAGRGAVAEAGTGEGADAGAGIRRAAPTAGDMATEEMAASDGVAGTGTSAGAGKDAGMGMGAGTVCTSTSRVVW